jgi:hypothetical protein
MKHLDAAGIYHAQHSYVIVPSNHRILNPEFKIEAKRHGKISAIGLNIVVCCPDLTPWLTMSHR